MFMPRKSGTANRTNTTIQQSIRSMFGEHNIDKDLVKYYASQDFYLPNTLETLEVQIETCVKFLDRMTQKDGIMSEGYVYTLEFIQDNLTIFQLLFRNKCLFGIKMAYLLDRVFQNFVNKLTAYQHRSHPITAARG
jgi:hypothetical protein